LIIQVGSSLVPACFLLIFVVSIAIIRTKAAADIITLKDDLVIAQRMRDQKLEYDRVARDIMKFETRDTYAE
jgi:THO complex subunit 7